MKEELISKETEVLLRKTNFSFPNPSSYNDYLGNTPTQSLLAKWLREVHNIHIDISIAHPLSYSLGVYIIDKKCFVIQNYYYDTYEEALEVGLYEALKLINNESKTS